MAHYAKINENNIVEQVIVADQEFINILDGEWIKTSYNTFGNKHKFDGEPLRGNYAGIGFIYNRELDVFYAPQPYPSFILTENYLWVAPIPYPYPNDGKIYIWDESIVNWKEIEIENY